MGIHRRTALRATAGLSAIGVTGLAGCATREPEPEPAEPGEDDEPDEPEDEGTLRVATSTAFVDDEESGSAWLKEAFEDEYEDAEINWVIPDKGIGHYIERERRDLLPEVDAYVGLSASDLVRVDHELEDTGLFRELNRDRIETAEAVRSALELDDPGGRTVPVSTQYSCLLVDERAIEPPNTLEALRTPEYADSLLVTAPQRDGRGFTFLSWLFESVGADGARSAWIDLEDNGLDVRDTWVETRVAYADGERPLSIAYAADALAGIDPDVVSSPEPDPDSEGTDDGTTDDDADESTDADDGQTDETAPSDDEDGTTTTEDDGADEDEDDDEDDDGTEAGVGDGDESGDDDEDDKEDEEDLIGPPEQYRVVFLDGESYAEPLYMGIFDRAINLDLAYAFLEFTLRPETQANLAPRLGHYPAIPLSELEFPEEFGVYAEYAAEPPTTTSLSYETRRDDLPGWIDDWTDEFGS